jgi:ribosomal protein L2
MDCRAGGRSEGVCHVSVTDVRTRACLLAGHSHPHGGGVGRQQDRRLIRRGRTRAPRIRER